MKTKFKAKTISLITLLAVLVCAIVATFIAFFVADNNAAQSAKDNAHTEISTPQLNKTATATTGAISAPEVRSSSSILSITSFADSTYIRFKKPTSSSYLYFDCSINNVTYSCETLAAATYSSAIRVTIPSSSSNIGKTFALTVMPNDGVAWEDTGTSVPKIYYITICNSSGAGTSPEISQTRTAYALSGATLSTVEIPATSNVPGHFEWERSSEILYGERITGMSVVFIPDDLSTYVPVSKLINIFRLPKYENFHMGFKSELSGGKRLDQELEKIDFRVLSTIVTPDGRESLDNKISAGRVMSFGELSMPRDTLLTVDHSGTYLTAKYYPYREMVPADSSFYNLSCEAGMYITVILSRQENMPYFNYDGEFVYGKSVEFVFFGGDGSGKFDVRISADNAEFSDGSRQKICNPEEPVTVRLTRAGNFEVQYRKLGDNNMYLDGEYRGQSFYINLAKYDMSGARWDYSSAFTYDGNVKTVSVTGLPAGVSVGKYSDNSATHAGNYTASVTAWNYDEVNYKAPSIAPCTWTINEAVQSVPTITGNTSVVYKSSITLAASGGNGTGAYIWSVATLSNGGTATLSAKTGGSVTLTANHVGTVRVTMYRAGDNDYNQSGSVTLDITINKATPTVTANVESGTYYVGNALSTVKINATAVLNGVGVNGAIAWDNPATKLLFDDGTVTYAWTWTPSDTANYNPVTGTAKVVALGMDDIRADGQKTAYKAYESFTTDGMTVYAISAGNEREVTGYSVSVSYGDGREYFLVSDSGCEVVITYTEGDKTKTYSFTVTVEKADYDMSGVTFDDLTVTYDGATHTITYSGTLPEGVSVTGYKESGVAFTGATNAGTYNISAVIEITDAANRNLPELNAVLKINKATATIDVSGVKTEYTYNGSLQTVSGGATASSGQEVKYANNTFTTVAEGNGMKVEVYVEESTNYVAHTEYVTITVNKATATIDVSGVKTEYTYNGAEQAVDSGATVDNGEQTVVYTNNTFTTVAEGNGMKVVIAVAESDNYLGASTTVTITVHKATLSNSVVFDDVTVTYDGKVHEIVATGFGGDVTVTYYYSGTTNGFTGETAVGTYEITAHFESASDNYEISSADAEKTATLTITAREITDGDVTGIDDTYEYTGTAQTPKPVIKVQLSADDAELTTLGEGDYKVTYSTSDANAGTEVEVTIELLGNYSGTVVKTFTITQKQLGIKWSTETSFTYNGSGQGMTAEFTGLVAGDVGKISPTIVYSGTGYPESSAMPEDAGTYTITVTLDGQYTNYVQFVGLTNRFTIKKATPTAAVKFDSYNPDTDKLYPDNKLPDIVADGDATANGLTVSGRVEWKLLDNGNAQYLLLNEHSYAWVFIPDDIVNFEVYEGTMKLTAVQAELKDLTVEWKDGEPTVYVSWDLTKIKDYILVTGTLENGDPYGEISNYVISGSWGMGERPVSAGEYDLKIVYNGKNGSLSVTYLAVELDSIKVSAPTKTEYTAFDEFDKTTVTVTAIYNDGTENEVVGFEIAYRAEHEYLWAGDGYVTVKYTEGGLTKDYQVGGLTVNAKTYDMGNIALNDVTVNYDGTLKTVTVTGTFAEGEVSYVYRQDGAAIPGVAGVTNAGSYEVVATFTLIGEEYLTNYYCDANGVIGSLTANLTVNKIDYVGVGAITFVDTETDYNYGASVVDAISVKNLPAGVTVSYSYADKDNNPLDPTQVVNAGKYFVTVSFGVDANHNAIQPMTVEFTVNKLDPKVTPKVSGNLSKGAHLYQVICALSDGDTAGTIVWDNDETVLEEGVNRCYYTFVPEDSVNFNTVNSFIDINASATGASAGGGLAGWEIALIVVCIVITFFTLIVALIVVSRKKVAVEDPDGFNDVVDDEDLY